LIRVVSLSPAIDVSYEITQLAPGQSHRVQKIHRMPGGKAANVARVLAGGGYQVELLLPLGGRGGDWLEQELSALGAVVHRVPITAEPRSCIAVLAQEVTVLNEPAPTLSDFEFESFLAAAGAPCDVIVFSGSVPNQQLPEQLRALFTSLRAAGEKLVIDTSGEALSLASEVGPDLLKPNRAEALAATGELTPQRAIDALMSLGAKAVLLSDGADGAVLQGQGSSIRGRLPERNGNPTGAGDAMVALAALSLLENSSERRLLSRAVAAGTLAVAETVAGVIDWSELEELANTVAIEE
jgi:tagatose 6-phosphate kinase